MTKVLEATDQMQVESQSESAIESQLLFLRAATAMSLSIDAIVKCQTHGFSSYSTANAMQLSLDEALISELRA